MQPASSPYNIIDKIKLANEALSNENPNFENRTVKVQFKEELVDYEPSLTEDDVNSIESDVNNEQELDEVDVNKYIAEDKYNNNVEATANVLNLHLYNTEATTVEEDNEHIQEELEIQSDLSSASESEENVSITEKLSNNTPEEEGGISKNNDQKHLETQPQKVKLHKSKKRFQKSKLPDHVDCRRHCIEKLDFSLNVSINKLPIHKKSPHCPTLKLQERKCCEDYRSKNSQSLPCYAGFRSEYGLSALQLERREKRKEIIRMKEERRKRLMEDFKERKRQQNEQVFCQWLKDVASRNKRQTPDVINNKESYTPSVVNLPIRQEAFVKDRPRTAGDFVPTHSVIKRNSKRPQTSSACVYIQVPHRLLKEGINVGNLLVTTSKSINNSKKNLHIMAVS